jgi:predicted Zn-dependent peptidase
MATTRAVRAISGKRFFSSSAVASSIETSFLSNGVRVVTDKDAHQSATVGLYFAGGSRSENTSNNGAGYLASQLSLKGSNSRSQSDLATELSSIGGITGSYFDRERTAFSITANGNKAGAAAELLIDATLNPAFSDAALEQEKNAVLNAPECNAELTMDSLHATAYQNSSLGLAPKGTADSMGALTRAQVLEFSKNLATGPRTTFAAAGNVDHAEMVKLAEKHLGGLPNSSATSATPERAVFVGSDVRYRDDFQKEAHLAIAFEGPFTLEERPAFILAKEIVGHFSNTMPTNQHRTARLAQETNKYGFANTYSSFLQTYSDTSLFGCYATCDYAHIDDFVFDLQQEWMRITRSVTDADLARARKVALTNILAARNGSSGACNNLGWQSIVNGQVLSAAELSAKFEAVDPTVLKSMMDKYFYDQCPAVAAVGPIESLTDYNRIRSNMFWLRI